MCTNKWKANFLRDGGLQSNHPDQNPNNDELSSEKVHCRKVSATFSRSSNHWGVCDGFFPPPMTADNGPRETGMTAHFWRF